MASTHKPTPQEIIDAAGEPVTGHSLSVEEMDKAVKEGRVLVINYWSTYGDGEGSFSFATSFGVTSEGTVHPSYIVFPNPIPLELRGDSESDWDSIAGVFASFGLEGGYR